MTEPLESKYTSYTNLASPMGWRMTHFLFGSSALLLLLLRCCGEFGNEFECRVSWDRNEKTHAIKVWNFFPLSSISSYIVAVVYLIDSRANVSNNFIIHDEHWQLVIRHTMKEDWKRKNFVFFSYVIMQLIEVNIKSYSGRNSEKALWSNNGEKDVNDIENSSISKFCGESCGCPQAQFARAYGDDDPKSTQN